MNFSELPDVEKWSLFKSGDDQAFSSIYTDYSKKLYHYGLKFTSDNVLIEDSIHDLFADLIKNRKKLGQTNNILFYLLKSFKRLLIRQLLKKNRIVPGKKIPENKFDVSYSVEHEIILNELSQEKTELLVKALKSLTPRQKEAVYLRFTKELDYNSVSGIMEISVEACRNLISGSVKTMKEVFKR